MVKRFLKKLLGIKSKQSEGDLLKTFYSISIYGYESQMEACRHAIQIQKLLAIKDENVVVNSFLQGVSQLGSGKHLDKEQ